MNDYCGKIKEPLHNFRRWIANLNLGLPAPTPILDVSRRQTETSTRDNENNTYQQQPTQAHGPCTSKLEDYTCPSPDSDFFESTNAHGSRVENTTEEVMSSPTANSPKNIAQASKKEMKEYREAFRLFDKDGDGSITKEELGIVMRSLGQFASEEELKEMLEEVDIDGDGTFTFEEFVQIITNYAGSTSVTDEEQELRDAFRIFDKHNRGYISASDLRAVLHCLGEDLSEDEIEDMIKEVDVDGDGRIDFDEFVRALGEPDESDEEESEFGFAQNSQ